MSRLDSQTGTGRGEICLAHDIGSSAEVGRDANTFENGSGGKEGFDIFVAKVVCACGDGGNTSSYKQDTV